MPRGYFFESASGVCFPEKSNIQFTLGLLNSKVISAFAQMLNPTATLQSGDLGKIPVVFQECEKISKIVDENISLSKSDWDAFETSWDFKKHPLI